MYVNYGSLISSYMDMSQAAFQVPSAVPNQLTWARELSDGE